MWWTKDKEKKLSWDFTGKISFFRSTLLNWYYLLLWRDTVTCKLIVHAGLKNNNYSFEDHESSCNVKKICQSILPYFSQRSMKWSPVVGIAAVDIVANLQVERDCTLHFFLEPANILFVIKLTRNKPKGFYFQATRMQ